MLFRLRSVTSCANCFRLCYRLVPWNTATHMQLSNFEADDDCTYWIVLNCHNMCNFRENKSFNYTLTPFLFFSHFFPNKWPSMSLPDADDSIPDCHWSVSWLLGMEMINQQRSFGRLFGQSSRTEEYAINSNTTITYLHPTNQPSCGSCYNNCLLKKVIRALT